MPWLEMQALNDSQGKCQPRGRNFEDRTTLFCGAQRIQVDENDESTFTTQPHELFPGSKIFKYKFSKSCFIKFTSIIRIFLKTDTVLIKLSLFSVTKKQERYCIVLCSDLESQRTGWGVTDSVIAKKDRI